MKKLQTIYHVGSLQLENLLNRPKTDYSLEGSGLSVSLHPEAWIKIARLGGRNLYQLEKQDPNFYKVTKKNKAKILNWCVVNGYIISQKKYAVEVFDEEGESAGQMEFETEAAAMAESEDYTEVDGYIFGPKGIEYWKSFCSSEVRHDLACDYADIFYAEAHGFDGVWWNEILDLNRLSAPRGVIFQSSLTKWSVKQLK